MSFNKRTSLTSDDDGEGVVGTVKSIDRAPDEKEKRVRVRVEGSRTDESILVPKKYAKNLKPEHKYEFHLEEATFRGGGTRAGGMQMSRRTREAPTELHESGLGGGGTGGGFGAR